VAYNYFSRRAETLLENLIRIERRLLFLCQKDLFGEALS